ncbi:MAG TPA: hypothetical protein VMY37_34520 [Thermoguttaceae bacterium]|nr:hypothetical protein [Thermoguttaceae bacterium]
MTAKSKTIQATTTPYKQRLIAVRNMLKTNRGSAYRVALELVGVYDDPDFLTDPAIAGDEIKAVKLLDGYAESLFVILPEDRSPFRDLAAMLKHYPEEQQWTGGKLSEMYDAMLAALAKPKEPPATNRRPPVRNAVHSAVVEKLDYTQKQLDRTKERLKQAQQRYEEVRETAEETNRTATKTVKVAEKQKTEIEQLREQLTAARKRIVELERENAELRKQLQGELVGV